MSSLQELRRFSLQSDVSEGGNIPYPSKKKKMLILAAGSILEYDGDAFVNAANEGCVGGFGVDEAVNKAGGFELKQARKKLHGCKTGSAKITPSFAHTKTKWIIHAVGPVYRSVSPQQKKKSFADLDEDLRSAYRACFHIAHNTKGVVKLGFCLLSSGVFRGERDLSDVIEIGMRVAVEELLQRSDRGEAGEEMGVLNTVQEVTFVAYTEEEQIAAIAIADRLRMEYGACD